MESLLTKYFDDKEISLISQGKYNILEASIKSSKENVNDTNSSFKLAILYFLNENTAKLQNTVTDLIKKFPNNLDAIYLFVSASFAFQKSMDIYIKYLNDLLTKSTNKEEAYVLCSQIYYLAENFIKAKECAKEALNINSQNYEALYVLSMCLFKDKKIDEAKECLLEAVKNQAKTNKIVQLVTPDKLDAANLSFSTKIFREGVLLDKNNKSLTLLYKLSYFKNNLFYQPLLWIEKLEFDNKYFWMILGIIVLLIPVMFFSSDFTIIFMEVFKWISTIIMFIYIPYQLIVYVLLSLVFPFTIKSTA